MNLMKFCISFYLLFVGGDILAHPVSYQGSRGIMGYHSPMMSHNQLNYSFRYWVAGGIHHIRRPDFAGRNATFASVNFLFKRWNASGLQANIYGVAGVGQSQLGPSAENSGLGLIQFDIEDRNYYFLAKHSVISNSERTDLKQSVIRGGFSPYVAEYDGIHSWLILEWQKSDYFDGNDLTDLTPFLRLFYKNILFEIGQSFDGMTKFNFITHF